jgi:hypothetical protein
MRGLIIYIVGIVLTLFAEAGRLKEAVTAIDARGRHTLVCIRFGLVLSMRGAQLVLVKSLQ